MNNGQESLGNLYVAMFRNGGMKIPLLFERRVAAPVIGNNGSAWHNDALDEATQRFGTSVWHHSIFQFRNESERRVLNLSN